MTKQKVNILIGLMALALLGIIVLQLVWMKNAMDVRNELFDRSVKEALFETSRNMETMSDVIWLRERAIVDPNVKRFPFFRYSAPSIRLNRQSVIAQPDTLILRGTTNSPIRRTIKNNVWVNTSDDTMHSGRNIRVEIVEMDSLISNMEQKIDRNITLMYNYTVGGVQSDTTITYNNGELQHRFYSRAERLKNVAGRMMVESWIMDQAPKPDTVLINQLLSAELQKRDIPIPYEMGVFYADSSLIKTDRADLITLANTKYQTTLFPHSIIDRNQQVAIYFPGRRMFVFRTLVGPAMLSLLLSAFVMGIFGLSIYYIINQKKVSEMKSDFINNMTHEFKTPIATISVAADTIVNRKIITNEERIRHFIQVIKKENLRMNQQVETILQIARLDKKDFEFRFKAVDIHELIDKAVQGIILQVENRNGRITLIKEAMNSLVTSDAAHTINMLNNLLDNANKYSPDEPEIVIKTRNSERGVWVSVADNGIGMSKQVQLKIFEKFYRETSGNIHNVKGFGLGLSYVKAVIDANKGEIKVVSEPGKGSTFEVFLPFAMID